MAKEQTLTRILTFFLIAGSWFLESAASIHAFPLSHGRAAFTSVVEAAKAPRGWMDFCRRHSSECEAKPGAASNFELTEGAWNVLVGVNQRVNAQIKQKTDFKHWGVSEKWDYPNDGYGDCEDLALLKRKFLMEKGWPREALLLTVVWTKQNQGHTVLLVHTNKGDFVLDSLSSKVVLWSKTGYDFVKRQSHSDPNSWVYIDGKSGSQDVAVTAKR